ncbi:MAG: hypothetical protein APF80_12905 [Alphaproteobacteria bacterium BRH_c36]|nr:MAG: hypothetical protein APF80_12905 [Alphaproteobacteria bacterium BRH_c36]
MALLAAVAMCWLALVTWSVTDPSLTHATRLAAANLLGYPGAVISDLMLQTFGLASALLLLAPMFWGLELVASGAVSRSRWKILSYSASVLMLAGALSIVPKLIAWPLNHGYGGIVGDGIAAVASWGIALALADYAAPLSFCALLACGFFFVLTSLGVNVEHMRQFASMAVSGAKRFAGRRQGRNRASDQTDRREPLLRPHVDMLREARAKPDNEASARLSPRLSLPSGPVSERHWQEPSGDEANDFSLLERDPYATDPRGETTSGPRGASRSGIREPDFVAAFELDIEGCDGRGTEFDSDTDADSIRIARRFAPQSSAGKRSAIRNVLRSAALRIIDPEDRLAADAAGAQAVENDPTAHRAAPRGEDQASDHIGEHEWAADADTSQGRAGPLVRSPPQTQTRTRTLAGAPRRQQPQQQQPESQPQPELKPRHGAAGRPAPLPALPRNAGGYQRPSLNLLHSSPAARPGPEMTQAVLRGTARLLEDVLERFGVKGEIREIRPGPVVTVFEVHLEKGSNPLRAVGLADDIGRAMNAGSVRVAVLPAPTGAGVAIEIPNVHRHRASLRDLLSGESYRSFGGSLPVALGRSTGGLPIVADLALLSNVLIAGRENSGKSTCLRSMLLSLVFRHGADDCRLVLFDPKFLEFGSFNGIPQLLCPVLSEVEKMMAALDWIVDEMDERAKRMAKLTARSVEIFNNRVRNARKRGEMIARTVHTGFCERTGQPIYEHEQMEFEPMPHIVVAIDELSVLMGAAPRECEAALVRIAEKGRGVGVHLVAATKTTTGLCLSEKIRASMASAIAFRLGSKVDSRLVLGEQGAEQLLDQGDAILVTGPGRTSRLHTPFVSSEEVEAVAAHLRAGGPSRYASSLMTTLQEVCEPFEIALAATPAEAPPIRAAAE